MSAAAEAEAEQGLLLSLAHSLHEICQPLTALQCRLEIEQMEREGTVPEGDDRTGRSLEECLRECGRLNDRVSLMRSLVRRALQEEREGQK